MVVNVIKVLFFVQLMMLTSCNFLNKSKDYNLSLECGAGDEINFIEPPSGTVKAKLIIESNCDNEDTLLVYKNDAKYYELIIGDIDEKNVLLNVDWYDDKIGFKIKCAKEVANRYSTCKTRLILYQL